MYIICYCPQCFWYICRWTINESKSKVFMKAVKLNSFYYSSKLEWNTFAKHYLNIYHLILHASLHTSRIKKYSSICDFVTCFFFFFAFRASEFSTFQLMFVVCSVTPLSLVQERVRRLQLYISLSVTSQEHLDHWLSSVFDSHNTFL